MGERVSERLGDSNGSGKSKYGGVVCVCGGGVGGWGGV